MPEGDTIFLAARRLRDALAGRPLTLSDFRVPRYATLDLRGRAVDDVVPRGKHLLARIEGGLTVHTHLKMDGEWRIRPAGAPPRDHRVRLVLANAEWMAAGYSLGTVEVLPTGEEDRAVGGLGPDLLAPDWDAAEAVRRLTRDPGRAVGEALLDQTLLAGIGNVYKSEILFLRGVHPWTPVGAVRDPDGMVDLARRLLDANKLRHGHVTTGDLRPGRRNWVYGRAGRPCLRCGTRIRRADQGRADQGRGDQGRGDQGPASGERVTFWCPRCQPEPRSARA